VHLSIFSRSTVPQGTRVESDGLTLDVVIAHGFGLKETVRHFDLYAEILPAESLVCLFLYFGKFSDFLFIKNSNFFRFWLARRKLK